MPKGAHILYCHCAYADVIAQDVKDEVVSRLSDSGLTLEIVPDLCELSARKDELLKDIARDEDIRIVACYPRTVRWLFHAAGAPLPVNRVQIFNMRVQSADSIVSALACQTRPGRSAERKEVQIDKTGQWIPWFPVIDYERCKGCQQCLEFCLFGVYSLSSEGRVEVRNPQKCKTNCPACARICPETAIIFPKYKSRPICGEDVDEKAPPGEKTKVDLSSLADKDVYSTLRGRGKSGRKRFSTDRGKDKEETPGQRRGCDRVEKLREALDIPSEVLESISPSEVGHIRRKLKGAAKLETEKDT